MADPFSRFTPRARRVLSLARDEAESSRHTEIGTEHLLLGLVREGRGLGAMALRQLGVNSDEVRRRLEASCPPGDVAPDAPLRLGPGAKHAMALAVDEANRLRHRYLGTEHLLLGLLRSGEGAAFVTLNSMGLTIDRVRRQVISAINEAPPDDRLMPAGPIGARRLGRSGLGTRGTPREVSARQFNERDDTCPSCDRVRGADWQFCAFCGETFARCTHCQTPLPTLADIRYCPWCRTPVDADEPE